MAAITPSTRKRVNMGDHNLLILSFATSDDADTFDGTGIKGIVRFWTQDTDNPTLQGSVGVAVQESAGTFTFFPAENAKSFDLYIMIKS